MKECPTCSHTQDTGKFCGKCGTELVAKQQQEEVEQHTKEPFVIQDKDIEVAATITEAVSEHHQQKEESALKTHATNFWQYTLMLLKNPATSFNQTDRQYPYGIIHFILFALSFSIALYYTMDVAYRLSLGLFMGGELPFLPIVIRATLILLLLFATTVIGTFLLEKIMTKQMSFKGVLVQYGGLLVPFILVQCVTIVTALAGFITLTIIFLVGSLCFTLLILPGILLYEQTSKQKKGNQRVYFGFATIATMAFLLYVVIRTTVLRYLEYIEDFIDYF